MALPLTVPLSLTTSWPSPWTSTTSWFTFLTSPRIPCDPPRWMGGRSRTYGSPARSEPCSRMWSVWCITTTCSTGPTATMCYRRSTTPYKTRTTTTSWPCLPTISRGLTCFTRVCNLDQVTTIQTVECVCWGTLTNWSPQDKTTQTYLKARLDKVEVSKTRGVQIKISYL